MCKIKFKKVANLRVRPLFLTVKTSYLAVPCFKSGRLRTLTFDVSIFMGPFVRYEKGEVKSYGQDKSGKERLNVLFYKKIRVII